jgi:hypothetical protein
MFLKEKQNTQKKQGMVKSFMLVLFKENFFRTYTRIFITTYNFYS